MEIIERLIDLVENTEPTCIVGVNTSVTYEEELVSLMKDKFYQYNLTQDGCVIEHFCV